MSALGSSSAHADATPAPTHAAATLSVRAEVRDADCVMDEVLRAGVASRLGYDPFAGSAVPTSKRIQVRVDVRRAAGAIEATVEILDASARGKRVVRANTCDMASANVELVIALAIDPVASDAPRAPKQRDVALAPTPLPAVPTYVQPASVPSAPSSPPVVAPSRASHLSLYGGVSAELGIVPDAAFALRMGARWQRETLALGIEGFGTGAVITAFDGGDLASRARGVEVLVGYDSGGRPERISWSLSIAGMLSALQVEGRSFVNSRGITHLQWGLGPRVAWDVPLSGSLSFSPWAEALAHPMSSVFVIYDGRTQVDRRVWESAPLSLRAGINLGVHFR